MPQIPTHSFLAGLFGMLTTGLLTWNPETEWDQIQHTIFWICDGILLILTLTLFFKRKQKNDSGDNS